MSTDAIISVLQELEKAANTDDLVYQIDVWSWAVDAMVLTAGRGQIEYLLHYGLPGEAKKQERASRRLLDRFERECRMRGIEESRYITQVLKGDFSHPHAKEEMFSSPAACLVDGEIKYALERLREAVISGATGDEPNDPATATPKRTAGGGGGGKVLATDIDIEARTLNEPSSDAFKAYRAHKLLGKTQSDVATMLNTNQGQVSRWVGETAAWLKAGNIMPDMPTLAAKPISVDPAVIEMGAREDRRTRRQRNPSNADADDARD